MKSGVFKLRQQWQDYSIKEYINGDEATTLKPTTDNKHNFSSILFHCGEF
ncbi:MAG TPA: hypothetical protein PLW02_00420 [Verrucomicrobiota bacterium]|nr:hypothetical protein [Verrucomicrobiota bacterium]